MYGLRSTRVPKTDHFPYNISHYSNLKYIQGASNLLRDHCNRYRWQMSPIKLSYHYARVGLRVLPLCGDDLFYSTLYGYCHVNMFGTVFGAFLISLLFYNVFILEQSILFSSKINLTFRTSRLCVQVTLKNFADL